MIILGQISADFYLELSNLLSVARGDNYRSQFCKKKQKQKKTSQRTFGMDLIDGKQPKNFGENKKIQKIKMKKR